MSVDKLSLEVQISRLQNLPPLPAVVPHVIRLVESENASAADLEQVIKTDAALTVKLLRTANSAYYRTGDMQVMSVRRAVAILGTRVVRSITLGVAFRGMFGTGEIRCASMNRENWWRHCLAVAVGSRILGALTQAIDPEEAFLSGLLHDVGKMCLDHLLPEEMARVILRTSRSEVSMQEAETAVLGFDHTEIGDLAAEKWGLPGPVHSAIVKHHSPGTCDLSVDHVPIVYAVHTANWLAHELGFDLGVGEARRAADPEVLKCLDLPSAQYEPIKKVISLEVERAQQAYSVE